jgi:hypothetical protein
MRYVILRLLFCSIRSADFTQVVSTDFIKSLGDCLLAGSLDVVHHHHIFHPVSTPVRVRYLGAFLYSGGYFLLVKVDKGRVYRMKHWFSLASFELVDIPQDTGERLYWRTALNVAD